MAINYACRWLSRDLLLALDGRRVDCSLSGVLRLDGPKYTVYEQVRQMINELGCRRVTRGRRAGLHNPGEVVTSWWIFHHPPSVQEKFRPSSEIDLSTNNHKGGLFHNSRLSFRRKSPSEDRRSHADHAHQPRWHLSAPSIDEKCRCQPKCKSGLEALAVYVHGARRTTQVVILYRPGSDSVSYIFFDDLDDIPEHTSTYACPMIMMGHLNLHLDVTLDPNAVRFQTAI